MSLFKTVDEHTIIAQCTPQGAGALALIRLCGSQAWDIAQRMSVLISNKILIEQTSHTVHYGMVVDAQQKPIDQVMFILMRGPKTFTGEDTVEITCHNNPFIIQAIIDQALFYGARLAQEGEFSRRAFINNKIDLLQAEAINELIGAQNQMALKKTLEQVRGSFSHTLRSWEQQLLTIFAWCQASFEFLDEEAEFAAPMLDSLKKLLEEIQTIKKSYNHQYHIRQGVRIALIGSVNAGKSSLFNMLIHQQRAIVTPQAGTTRDTIEAGVYRNGFYWTFIDTAGLRQTDNTIEQEGIKRSYEEAQKADIILLVFDSSRPLTQEEEKTYRHLEEEFSHKIIVVFNKADCNIQLSYTPLSKRVTRLSTVTRSGKKELEEQLEKSISSLFENYNSPFLLTKRQISLVAGLEEKLTTILALLTTAVHYELVAYHLQDALEHISQLTGKTISEAAMDAVFKEFCIGK